jgi:nucleoside 2-deoxyribosyltransferase
LNRLSNTRCYLAGAMENDADNISWRESIKSELADLRVNWLDPTNKPIQTARETPDTMRKMVEARQAGDYDSVRRDMRLIRCVDLRMTDISDFLVVNIDPRVPTWGTPEEIANANRQKKPVIARIVTGKENTPLWLLGEIPHELVFSTWAEVHQYLRHIAHDEVIDTLGRWYFFDFTGN